MDKPTVQVAVLAASGYTGGAALRLLLGHPNVEVVAVTSIANADRPVTSVHPHLNGLTSLTFRDDISNQEASEYDAIFMALPHGQAMERVPAMLVAGGKGGPRGDGAILFDLSGDFRIKDQATFEEYYGLAHSAPEWAAKAAYGLTEWNRE